MPETRSTNQSTDTIAALADLRTRTDSLEAKMQKQVEETSNLSSTIETMMDMMRSMHSRMDEVHMTPRRTDKQPMESAPLLPTPASSTMVPAANHGSRLHQQAPDSGVSGTSDTTTVTQVRLPKLDVPTFNGEDVDGWLFQLDRYFEHHAVPLNQRLIVAIFHMSGEALKWLQWIYATHNIGDWNEF